MMRYYLCCVDEVAEGPFASIQDVQIARVTNRDHSTITAHMSYIGTGRPMYVPPR